MAKGKCKGHPVTCHEAPEVEQSYSSTLSVTSTLSGGRWSTPRPGRYTPGKDPVLIVQEVGQAPGPVWTGAENLAPTRIRSPDRPARSESLHLLRYPGPPVSMASVIFMRMWSLLSCDIQTLVVLTCCRPELLPLPDNVAALRSCTSANRHCELA